MTSNGNNHDNADTPRAVTIAAPLSDAITLGKVWNDAQAAARRVAEAEAERAALLAVHQVEPGFYCAEWCPPTEWGKPVMRWHGAMSPMYGVPYETLDFANGQRINRLLIAVHRFDTGLKD